MANGDITAIKPQGRLAIPTGGFSTGGVSKNSKVAVWGEITGTWTDTTGLNLSAKGGAKALGVSTVDYVQFWVKTVAGVASTDEAIFTASLGSIVENIMVVVDGLTNPTAADSIVLSYLVIGDSNANADLT